MKRTSVLRVFFALMLTTALMGTLVFTFGKASQGAEKSLDIERYPNEPLELTDLQIHQKSVKSGIRFKSKDNINQWGVDNVRFQEQEDWVKNVRIRLRNAAGRPIIGISAGLFLHPNGVRMLFEINLKAVPARDLRTHPLQRGEALDFEVTEAAWKYTMDTMARYGISPAGLPVSLSVDSATFSDDLQWSRGSLMRRDPGKPNSWRAIDTPRPSGASRS